MKRNTRSDEMADYRSLTALEKEVQHQRHRFARKLKKRREQLRMSQSELARLVGSQQPAIARMESDKKTTVSLDFLVKVALVLGFPAPIFLPTKTSSWRGLRGEVAHAVKAAKLEASEFSPVEIRRWKSLEERILKAFFSGNRLFVEGLKESRARESLYLRNGETYGHLELLVDPSQHVWLLVADEGERKKIWSYKATVRAARIVLDEVFLFGEWFCVGPKLEWLLGGNDEGYLTAIGRPVVDRMKKLH